MSTFSLVANDNELDSCEELVLSAIDSGDYGLALDDIAKFVGSITSDSRSVGKVFSSSKLDKLCELIGEKISRPSLELRNNIKTSGSIILVTQLVSAGGHIELIKDYIRLGILADPITVVTTEYYADSTEDSVNKFLATLPKKVSLVRCKEVDTSNKISFLLSYFDAHPPEELFIIASNHDSLAISLAGVINCKVTFIHHGDHHLCLGVHSKKFSHVDIHNVGYFICRNELGISNNRYWPLVIGPAEPIPGAQNLCIKQGSNGILTCTSGRYEKFVSDGYRFDYFELLPKILSVTKGSHVHIGQLTSDQLQQIKTNFEKSSINWNCFHHIPWVPSISSELLSLGVDLYISSFPLGGGKTILEAMSVGIPLLMHENYRSRLLGGVDISYPEAFVWRNEAELFGILKDLSPQVLEKHSKYALSYFMGWHSEKILIDAVGDLGVQDVTKIPKLREYYPDLLKIFLENKGLIDSKAKALSDEIARIKEEWLIAVNLAKENQDKVRLLDQGISELNQKIKLIHGSLSWRLTRPLRWIKKILGEKGFQKAKAILKKTTQFPLTIAGGEGDFDEKFYCAMYPDILRNGLNPLEHFRLHGKAEGRIGKRPPLDIRGAFEDFSDKLETVFVVSHEATLTGAPILAKNIVDDLRGRYNIIVMLMGGGPLVESFYHKGIVMCLASAARNNELIAEDVISLLLQDRQIKFAIVNTIESSSILPSLAKRGIPAISLIHEFASSVKNKEGFRKSFFWAEKIVFSNKITHENLIDELPELKHIPVNILAQGKSSTKISNDSGLHGESRRELDRFLQAQNEGCMVLLGIGTIYYRKGVDLFIQCASYLKLLNPEKEFVFVWIGKNVDDELGTDYSSYLNDQIKRNGLENKVFFFEEMADIDFVYKAADILLLTSRLDPLPNVAIDALFNGVPVLCFDRASGIAEILKEEGLEALCIAPFLDVKCMAQKILELTNSEELFQATKRQCQNFAKARFSMADYVLGLEKIAEEAVSTKAQLIKDVSDIKNSGLFRLDFATANNWRGLSEAEVISAYVRGWRSGIDQRKPMPGFHPGIYKEKHGVANLHADPFADFIRAGLPSGPWITEVLNPCKGKTRLIAAHSRVALHIHVFYPELLTSMLDAIALNQIQPDLFISVSNDHAVKVVKNIASGYAGLVKKIVFTPNCGRDIGAFLTEFGRELVTNYDIIGHIHTKKSPHAESRVGEEWSNFLLANLLGRKEYPMIDEIVEAMSNDEFLGLVFPDDPNPIGWDKNLKIAQNLAAELNLPGLLPGSFNFPVGTMFWIKSASLKPLVDYGLVWGDYPVEPLPIDGTILHAIERLMPFIVSLTQKKYISTNIINISR